MQYYIHTFLSQCEHKCLLLRKCFDHATIHVWIVTSRDYRRSFGHFLSMLFYQSASVHLYWSESSYGSLVKNALVSCYVAIFVSGMFLKM